MKHGDRVMIADTSPATLQHGLTGIVIAVHSATRIMVELKPDADGLYGGRYWFAESELEHADAALAPEPSDD